MLPLLQLTLPVCNWNVHGCDHNVQMMLLTCLLWIEACVTRNLSGVEAMLCLVLPMMGKNCCRLMALCLQVEGLPETQEQESSSAATRSTIRRATGGRAANDKLLLSAWVLEAFPSLLSFGPYPKCLDMCILEIASDCEAWRSQGTVA